MTIKEILQNFKEIQKSILSFVEKEDAIEENFKSLKHKIEEQQICNNSYEYTLLLHLIAKIADNHFQETDFNSKIQKILLLFKNEIKEKCQDSEIFNIFKNNKKILLFLLEEKILDMNNYIATMMQNGKYKKEKYPQYFFPEIKPYIKHQKEKKYKYKKKFQDCTNIALLNQMIRKQKEENDEAKNEDAFISEFSIKLPENFYENRKIGENESKICELIRKDLIDNFISYVKRENYQLNSTIPPSIYETNSFLLKKSKPTLIEYASFFGSNQIFKFLYKNGVVLTPSLWEYAVHSNNPETIHLLEENDVKPYSYSNIFNEAIKCHHNDVANYIMSNYMNKENKAKEEDENDDSLSFLLKSYNFEFLQEDSINHKSFFNLCKYDYCLFVEHLIKQENIDVNESFEKTIKIGFNETFTENKKVLHVAIEKGNINMIKLLLTNENLDTNSKKKYVILNPCNKKLDFMILCKGYEWISWDEYHSFRNYVFVEITPLNLAIENDNIEIIKMLLENKNTDINLFSNFSRNNPYNNYNDTESYKLISPLHAAVEKENLEIIQLLLENESIDTNLISIELLNNPDGNGKNIVRRESTALAIAVENESFETVKLLISSEKVDINLSRFYFSYNDEHEEWSSRIDEKERPPLFIAIYKNNIEIFKLLLNSERIDLNRHLIELESEIRITDSHKWSERRAPDHNPTFKTSYLWNDIPEKWISTLDENKNEKSPLYYAIELNYNEIAQLLLENEKIDVNFRNKLISTNVSLKDKINENKVEEKTALNFAIENENIDAVNLLLQNDKIDIDYPSKLSIKPKEFNNDDEENEKAQNVQNEEKEIIPMKIATEKGNEQIIEIIKSYKK